MGLAEEHMAQGMNDLEHYMASCSELVERVEQKDERIKELENSITTMNNKCVKIRRKLETDLALYKNMAAKSYTACGEYQKRVHELETEVKHPIDSEGKVNHRVSYCYACGANVKNQKYCQNCGRKLLLWPGQKKY